MSSGDRIILVTGAAGQLGRELLLLSRALPAGVRIIGVERATCDVADPEAVRRCIALHRPVVVINAAAYTAVDRAEAERARAFAVNADGPAHLAAACADAGIPLFHVSTDYVFDGSKATAWRVDDKTAPLGVYGASKLAGEHAVRAACAQHLVLRTSWVFGQHGNNFVRTMVRLAATRDVLRVVADQRGSPTWTGDIAAELLALAVRHLDGEELAWGIWHYTGAPATNWYDFAGVIVDEAIASGLLARRTPVQAITTAEFPTPARRPVNSVLDMSTTTQALGIVASDWRVGLRRVLAGWRRNGVRFER